MGKLLFFFMLLIFTNNGFADSSDEGTEFHTAKGVEKLRVFANWAHICRLGQDSVEYTIHRGSFEYYCALSYSYTRCSAPTSTDGSCPGGQWKNIADNKLLYRVSNLENKNFCRKKAKEMAEKLKTRGFKCTESGVN